MFVGQFLKSEIYFRFRKFWVTRNTSRMTPIPESSILEHVECRPRLFASPFHVRHMTSSWCRWTNFFSKCWPIFLVLKFMKMFDILIDILSCKGAIYCSQVIFFSIFTHLFYVNDSKIWWKKRIFSKNISLIFLIIKFWLQCIKIFNINSGKVLRHFLKISYYFTIDKYIFRDVD